MEYAIAACVMAAILICAGKTSTAEGQESHTAGQGVAEGVPGPSPTLRSESKDGAPAGAVIDGTQDKKKAEINTGVASDPRVGRAEVLAVKGTVHRAGPGVSAFAKEGWSPVKVGDRLAPGTQIRTGLRSFVHLQFGQSNFVSIERATIASIDQFYRSASQERVRIGLGYGTIRGGSTEGTVRSDLVVDSPVATMAKRGTEGWQIAVEPHTGRFNISLARFGLVEAIQKLDTRRLVRRQVRPGEYATAQNIASMWLKQDIFDRAIRYFKPEAVTLADARFLSNNTTGVSMIAPGGGARLTEFTGRGAGRTGQRDAGLTLLLPPIRRPEGNFGVPDTGR